MPVNAHMLLLSVCCNRDMGLEVIETQTYAISEPGDPLMRNWCKVRCVLLHFAPELTESGPTSATDPGIEFWPCLILSLPPCAGQQLPCAL